MLLLILLNGLSDQIDHFAYFLERPRRPEELLVPHPVEWERPFAVVGTVTLSELDYENFVTDLLADRGFLEEKAPLCAQGEVWRCLLIRQRGRKEGMPVLPTDEGHVRWAADFPGP